MDSEINNIKPEICEKIWVCNECNCPNFTLAVSEEEIKQELHSCINYGGFEFHVERRKK